MGYKGSVETIVKTTLFQPCGGITTFVVENLTNQDLFPSNSVQFEPSLKKEDQITLLCLKSFESFSR